MRTGTIATRRFSIALLALALSVSLSAIGCSAPADKPAAPAETPAAPQAQVTKLQVYADESLEDVLTRSAPTFEQLEGLQLVLTFGPSAELRTAIEDGAAVDAFVSADAGQMEGLVEAGLVERTASQDFATGEDDVRYVAAPLKGAERRALGSIYVLYLKSPQVQQALKDAGFGPPSANQD